VWWLCLLGCSSDWVIDVVCDDARKPFWYVLTLAKVWYMDQLLLLLMLSTHIDLGLPSGLYFPVFSTKNRLHLFYLLYVLCAPPISFLILSPKWHLVKSKDHNSPCYILFFSPCLLHPSQAQISSEHCVLREPQSLLHPQCQRPSFTAKQNTGQNYSSLYLNLHIFI
jgi:hypothetical protein